MTNSADNKQLKDAEFGLQELRTTAHSGNVPDGMDLFMEWEGWQVFTRKNPDPGRRISIKLIRTVPAKKGNFWLLFDSDACEFLPHPDLSVLAARYPQAFLQLLCGLLSQDYCDAKIYIRL